MSEDEKEILNQPGRSFFREDGFILEDDVDYDGMRNNGGAGYASYYLYNCWNESEMKNEADVSIHRRLVDIDSKLGTNASLQLFGCIMFTTRWDLIKV